MKKNLKIILLEDSQQFADATEELFRQQNHFVILYHSASELCAQILEKTVDYDIAIIDREIAGDRYAGDDVIAQLRKLHPKKPIICLSGYEVEGISDTDVCLHKINDFLFSYDGVYDIYSRAIEQAFESAARRIV